MAVKTKKDRTPQIRDEIKNSLFIDFSDLSADLDNTLKQYGYFGHLLSQAISHTKVLEYEIKCVEGKLYVISKDDVLETTGKPPSDTYIQASLTEDDDWNDLQKEQLRANAKAGDLRILVRGLEIKLESLRTLMANERMDKSLHLKD